MVLGRKRKKRTGRKDPKKDGTIRSKKKIRKRFRNEEGKLTARGNRINRRR